MAITNIIKKLTLNKEWYSVDLGHYNDFYIIAIKDAKNKKDTIDSDAVVQVRFEIGIDSGIKDKPLTIQFVTLNFNDVTSSDPALNKITALQRVLNFPGHFYIRPVSIDTADKTLTTGTTSISVNINAVNLGA